MTELPDFFIRALIAGGALALMTGPLGCLMVWRRMAFFGDALAHAALLGVALGLWLQGPVWMGVLALSLTFAIILTLLARSDEMSADTLLGILSPGALALGLIALNLLPGARIDLGGYLFGDILAISGQQVAIMLVGAPLVLLVLAALWKPLLQLTLAPDLARSNGMPVRRVELALLILLALVVAVGVQLVGVLLLTALLIIPAATARRYAATPEQMIVLAAAFGALASTAGLFMSLYLNLPTGPSMVTAAVLFFLLSRAGRR